MWQGVSTSGKTSPGTCGEDVTERGKTYRSGRTQAPSSWWDDIAHFRAWHVPGRAGVWGAQAYSSEKSSRPQLL